MKKILFIVLCSSFSIFAFEAINNKSEVINLNDQVKLRRAGLKLNKAGRKYLEEQKKLTKGKEYEITMRCIAGSRQKCLLIRLDDLK